MHPSARLLRKTIIKKLSELEGIWTKESLVTVVCETWALTNQDALEIVSEFLLRRARRVSE